LEGFFALEILIFNLFLLGILVYLDAIYTFKMEFTVFFLHL